MMKPFLLFTHMSLISDGIPMFLLLPILYSLFLRFQRQIDVLDFYFYFFMYIIFLLGSVSYSPPPINGISFLYFIYAFFFFF